MDPAAADVRDITSLVHRYARLLDAGDLDGVAALFEHAQWRSDDTNQVVRGTAAARAIYDNVHLYEDGTPRTKHVITNLTVELDPDGTHASAQSYFTVLQGVVRGEPISVIIAGQYRDRFERAGDGWRFAERMFVVDLVGDLSRHFG